MENGSSWVEPLLKNMADVYKKMPQEFLEDPVEVIKRNIYISPFWEEDLGALAELIGVDHVLFGSDYPHPEGLADPASYVDELDGLRRRGRPQDHGRQPGPADERRPTPSPDEHRRRLGADHPGHHRRGGRPVRRPERPSRTVRPALTYAELFDEARTFAAALVASGVEPGDRVAIWAFNSAEWVVAALGLWQAGAVLVPINTRFKGGEAADILPRSRARVLVTVTDFLGTDYVAMLRATGAELPDLETVVVARGAVPDGAESWDAFGGRATDADRRGRRPAERRVGPDDPSDILFTSGTTGAAQGRRHDPRPDPVRWPPTGWR